MQGVGIVGNAVGNAIGSAIGEALFGPPPGSPEDIQAQQAAAAQAAQAAAAAQTRAAAAQARANAIRGRLLGEMVNFDAAAPPPPPPGADSGLVVDGMPLMPTDTAPGQTVVNFGVPASVACKTAINCNPDGPPASSDGAVPVPNEHSIPQVPSNATGAAMRAATRSNPPPPVGLLSWTPQLLRSATQPGGHPVGKQQPSAACQQVAAGLDQLYRFGRFAGLAQDAYDRYDPNNVARSAYDGYDPKGGGAIRRISDDRTAMQGLFPSKLFRGLSDTTLRQLLAPPGSDYRAAIYRDRRDPKQIYLVFRGTQSLLDWLKGNIPQQTGHPTEYFNKAIALAKLVKKAAAAQGLNLTIVGHSLGGGMADAAGAVTHTTTVSFNPEGVHPNTLPEHFDIASAKKYVTDVVVDDEPLNFAQDHRLTVKAVYDGLVLGNPGALAATATAAGATLGDTHLGSDLASGLGPASLAPAIGRRVTIEPDPHDISNLQLQAIKTAAEDLAANVAGASLPLPQTLRNVELTGMDWVRLHQMTGVTDALSHQFDDLYAQYKQLGCAAQ